jgi:hypothetical protein
MQSSAERQSVIGDQQRERATAHLIGGRLHRRPDDGFKAIGRQPIRYSCAFNWIGHGNHDPGAISHAENGCSDCATRIHRRFCRSGRGGTTSLQAGREICKCARTRTVGATRTLVGAGWMLVGAELMLVRAILTFVGANFLTNVGAILSLVGADLILVGANFLRLLMRPCHTNARQRVAPTRFTTAPTSVRGTAATSFTRTHGPSLYRNTRSSFVMGSK